MTIGSLLLSDFVSSEVLGSHSFLFRTLRYTELTYISANGKENIQVEILNDFDPKLYQFSWEDIINVFDVLSSQFYEIQPIFRVQYFFLVFSF